ncbi:hypothetical protein [Shinella sp. M27]|uniref:hypothetical protein n=1 Tax=Shinella sp. M27 TaxID=3368614 RepID=UPI003B9EC140
MPAYMISYDLRKVKNYDALIKELRGWGCIRPLKSFWLGNLKGNSNDIVTLLRKHMDGDDGIVVCEIKPTNDWTFANPEEHPAAWFKKFVGG